MHNSFVPVSSATVGGLSKAFVLGFSGPVITLPQVIEVSVYAVISATLGYLVKLGIDQIKESIIKRKTRKSNHHKNR